MLRNAYWADHAGLSVLNAEEYMKVCAYWAVHGGWFTSIRAVWAVHVDQCTMDSAW